jgi:hypothetical protein
MQAAEACTLNYRSLADIGHSLLQTKKATRGIGLLFGLRQSAGEWGVRQPLRGKTKSVLKAERVSGRFQCATNKVTAPQRPTAVEL